MARVDDRAIRPAVRIRTGADEQRRDDLDRLLRRRQAHAGRRYGADVGEPFEREAEMAPPLVPSQRVDLVHDDGLDGVERGAALRRGDEEVERLGRGDDEGARAPDHRRPLAGGGVARADPDRQIGRGQAELSRLGADLGERPFEVLRDVDRQGLQRRDVDDPRAADRLAARVGEVQAVDGHEEAGQRLAGPRRGGDQGVLPAAIGGQAASCAGVGPSGNRSRNQAATAGCSSTEGRSVVSTVTPPSSRGSNSGSCVGADTGSPYVRRVTPRIARRATRGGRRGSPDDEASPAAWSSAEIPSGTSSARMSTRVPPSTAVTSQVMVMVPA